MAYFSNGTDGERLERQCEECLIGRNPDAGCPILLNQYLYNYDQCRPGNELLRESMSNCIDDSGICKMKVLLDEYIGERNPQ